MATFDFKRPKNVKLTQTSTEPETPTTPTEIATTLSTAVVTMAESFKPTEAQRLFKTRWWRAYNDTIQHTHPRLMDLKQLRAVYDSPFLAGWMKNGDFVDFLYNDNENADKLEGLFAMALDAAKDILTNTDPKAQSARVNMIKIVAELANKTPKKNEVTYVDKQINTMSKEELAEYIKKSLPATVVESAPTGDKEDGK